VVNYYTATETSNTLFLVNYKRRLCHPSKMTPVIIQSLCFDEEEDDDDDDDDNDEWSCRACHTTIFIYRAHNFKQTRVRGTGVARWGTSLAEKGKEMSSETAFKRTNGW